AVAFASKVQNSRLAGKYSTLGCGDDGSEPGFAPGCNTLIAEIRFVSGNTPWRCAGAIFGPARDRPLWTGIVVITCTTNRRGRQGCETDIGEGVDEAGINGQPRAVDHPRFFGYRSVLANRGNDSARNDHGGVLNGEVLWLASFCLNFRASSEKNN